MYLYILLPVLAFGIAMLLFPLLRKLAFRIHLVDKPNHRKMHTNHVPLVGGIGVFISANIAILIAVLFDSSLSSLRIVFVLSLILLIIGVIDDSRDLRASVKLAVQLLLAHFAFSSGIRIETLSGIFGIYEIAYWAQYLLTILVIAGVVNAFNLMDGIDGLAAGMAIIGMSVFSGLALLIGQHQLALEFLTFVGALIAFLRFNLSREKKIFMGDAGSLVLGFILVVGGISMIQAVPQGKFSLIVLLGVISVLMVPVLDAIRVFRVRIKSGKSPFTADRNHLHHLVLSLGIKHTKASLVVVSLALTMILIGFLAFQWVGITIAIVIMLLIFYVITNLLSFNSTIRNWKIRIKKMENGEL